MVATAAALSLLFLPPLPASPAPPDCTDGRPVATGEQNRPAVQVTAAAVQLLQCQRRGGAAAAGCVLLSSMEQHEGGIRAVLAATGELGTVAAQITAAVVPLLLWRRRGGAAAAGCVLLSSRPKFPKGAACL